MKTRLSRQRLMASTMICGAAFAALAATPVFAQEEEESVQEIVVTGSRLVRQDYIANSPIASVTGDQTVANADVTLDTYLNNLPQVNPAGTTTSNNPGNGGQSNIDLRGFGANRNIVLVDGRRSMVSAANLTVDVNTIPQAMIERIEVITGGAGAAYGADAIAGAVNVIIKKNFEGVDFRANYSNSTEYWDSKEYQFSLVLGGNFNDGRGNAVFGFDRSFREPLIKAQRPFAKNATSTTSFLPEGALFWASGNPIPQAAFDTLFASVGGPLGDHGGQAPGTVNAGSGNFGFNLDGTMFYKGVFNSPLDVVNFKYPIDDNVNANLYPDLYSYNFDYVNLLVLPLDRYAFRTDLGYEMDNGIELFASAGWTEYVSDTALAPTPIPTVAGRAPSNANSAQYTSTLICQAAGIAGNGAADAGCGAAGTITNLMVIPTTNPFIPASLAWLLSQRVGNNTALNGSGATEPFTMRQRTLDIGLRRNSYENTVVQFMTGARGPLFGSGWEWEAYISEGRTEIDQTQTGNVDTQRLQTLLEAVDGGASICAGGFNPFGRHPISGACQDYLESTASISTTMTLQVGQAFIRGDLFELPAGPVQTVFGLEYRGFEFNFDPGTAAGPISGFNQADPAGGTNSFKDVFAEALFPLVKDQPWMQNLELSLGWRNSTSEFVDKVNNITSDSKSSTAFKAELNWEMNDIARVRASYQQSVRAPNFAELFSGGGSAPQYFDPCSVTSDARQGNIAGINAASLATLCQNAGIFGGVSAGAINTYVQTPGNQIGVTLVGNPDLDPETGKTLTLGLVLNSPWDDPWLSRLRGSIDYYNIRVDDAILVPTPNQIVAACYNYYGTNPTYSTADPNCQGILRFGGDILWIYNPTSGFAEFQADNGGSQESSGVDIQVDYGFDMEWLGFDPKWGTVATNVLITHVMEFKQQDPIAGVPEHDFGGTISYFGAGLGTSFPTWKAVWSTNWDLGDFNLNARMRYIGEMDNRMAVEFPGETEFTGTGAVAYWDFSGGWQMTDNVELRLGVNNAFDKEPEQYAPNVQSGTDPSTYDVVGRRVFAQLRLRY